MRSWGVVSAREEEGKRDNAKSAKNAKGVLLRALRVLREKKICDKNAEKSMPIHLSKSIHPTDQSANDTSRISRRGCHRFDEILRLTVWK